ncbi:hypothetical protein [Oceanobacillus manasiensis]|uniref:hypothetical protein n=1 Tax=Oceanobacillus manasiensis TaxID=586413 RepID=UPI0005AB4B8C|nr:hypothetical protein [Oceanobacillus manasiensis]
MTAEVAIMNKLGMSLAADSAITSGRDGVQKVYNSANKLFSISNDHSVGIMVYGAASFMEVPWDVIIKSYRDYVGDKKLRYLSSYMEDFIAFIKQDGRFNVKEMEEVIIYRSYSDNLKRLIKTVEEELEEERQQGNEVTDDDATRLLANQIDKVKKEYEEKEEIYIDMDLDIFKQEFHKVIQEVNDDFISYNIPDHIREKLSRFVFEVVRKDYFSLGSTGLVIAGFGEEEIFPQLLNYRLEGFVFGQLKYKKVLEKKISYSNSKDSGTAAITPFAQREMVDSFMGGIEPNMEDAILGIVHKVLSTYHQQVENYLQLSLTEEQVSKMEKMGNDVYESIEDAVDEYRQSNYITPLLGIVRSLPKEELADMAEALVNLTSFKRRVSRATESVGPPVDVAVITKGDGFVWVKRKNYIDPVLNN